MPWIKYFQSRKILWITKEKSRKNLGKIKENHEPLPLFQANHVYVLGDMSFIQWYYSTNIFLLSSKSCMSLFVELAVLVGWYDPLWLTLCVYHQEPCDVYVFFKTIVISYDDCYFAWLIYLSLFLRLRDTSDSPNLAISVVSDFLRNRKSSNDDVSANVSFLHSNLTASWKS